MINTWIENDLEAENSGIFRLRGHGHFSYSDGADSEKYLNQVFDSCEDLSSGSPELARRIKDWRSEYHLSPKRSTLLDVFTYETSSNVLEVGCGCGAISRFLGETFEQVVSIEGSVPRARLAKKRCRDLENVHFVAAPFQELNFRKKFDIIFCIGVLEYSNKFVDDPDPYNSIVNYFSKHLSKDGVLVIAIENRLGLKYFNAASEDHTGRAFDGIEDYPGTSHKAKTFGQGELRDMLSAYFPSVDFYFPFPDYKVPDAVFSEQLLKTTDVNELLGKFESRDYNRPYRPLFSERKAWRSLAMNGLIPQFANSFLVVARKSAGDRMTFDSLGIIKNFDRAEEYRTHSTIYLDRSKGDIRISKSSLKQPQARGPVELVEYDELWRNGATLHTIIERRACEPDADLEYVFAPATTWYQYISKLATESEPRSGMVADHSLSRYFDAIWQNTIVQGAAIYLIDQEWSFKGELTPKQLLIRAIYAFLASIRENKDLSSCLIYKRGVKTIRKVARLLDEEVTNEDIRWLLKTESAVYSSVTGNRQSLCKFRIQVTLRLPPIIIRQVLGVSRMREYLVFAVNRLRRALSRLLLRIPRVSGRSPS